MGFSSTMASTIILIGLISFTCATSAATLITLNNLVKVICQLSDKKPSIKLEIEIVSINSSTIYFYIMNKGSQPIFFREDGYRWNSVVVAYNNTGWRSYLIENYTILEIRVTGTNISFNVDRHKLVNPGEEAHILLNLPSGAPEIPMNGAVVVVFISYYGVSAIKEGVRS